MSPPRPGLGYTAVPVHPPDLPVPPPGLFVQPPGLSVCLPGLPVFSNLLSWMQKWFWAKLTDSTLLTARWEDSRSPLGVKYEPDCSGQHDLPTRPSLPMHSMSSCACRPTSHPNKLLDLHSSSGLSARMQPFRVSCQQC